MSKKKKGNTNLREGNVVESWAICAVFTILKRYFVYKIYWKGNEISAFVIWRRLCRGSVAVI